MKYKFWQFTSFSTRLSFWVITTVATILLVTAFIANFFIHKGIIDEETLKAEAKLDNAEQRIEQLFIAVETAVKNHANEISRLVNAPHEEMYRITREIVETNDIIVGSAIAFKPNYYPDQGRYFSPYSYIVIPENSKFDLESKYPIASKQLGSVTYDYPTKEWFQKPGELKKGYWCDPYIDTGGGEIMMVTYSYPLIDEQDSVYAILTADVSLEWLSQMMDSLKYYEQSYSFILSRNGTLLAHPVKERVMHETIFEGADQLHSSSLAEIGTKMVKGEAGNQTIQSPKLGEAYIFYTPLQHTGWSMAIVCSSDEFFKSAHRTGFIVAVLIFLMLVVLAITLRAGVRRLTLPLTHLTQAVNEVASGNLQATLPKMQSKDEMRKLYNSFHTMQKSLTWQMEELKRINGQKGRIEGELKVASGIQRAMLPKTFPPYPERDDVDIYGQLTPAKAVGGDLFDFYIRDEKLFFCIGDVSGKGVPASLVMAVARSLFRTLSVHEPHPNRIIAQMNDRMAEDNEYNMFVTLFIGVLDLPTGKLRYCNAGHDAPILLTSTPEGTQKTYLPCDSNLPIGVMGNFKFSLQDTTISPDTTIFLYTDGLTEAEDIEHHQFGEQRIMDALTDATSHEIINRMTDAVHAFTGDAEQSDDLTMLVIRYTKHHNIPKFQKEITLTNDINQVPQLAEFVDAVCETVGFDDVTTMQMNLALEEAVVNVMNYAYPPDTKGDIRIEAAANDKRLKFIISDSGMPFDPTTHRPVDTTLSAEERPIGGLGIHLIAQLMDSINYERKDHMNVLTLRKKLINDMTPNS